jgi:hypothetical protein
VAVGVGAVVGAMLHNGNLVSGIRRRRTAATAHREQPGNDSENEGVT